MKIFRNLQSLKLKWISIGAARGTPLNPAPLNPPAKFEVSAPTMDILKQFNRNI